MRMPLSQKGRLVAQFESVWSDLQGVPFSQGYLNAGGFRTRYRSLENGDPAPRGSIDPFIGISFKLGPKVDSSGELPDGRKFDGIADMQAILAANPDLLLTNLANQFAVYGTGRPVAFGDREAINAIVASTKKQGGGIRTLLHELLQSELFRTK